MQKAFVTHPRCFCLVEGLRLFFIRILAKIFGICGENSLTVKEGSTGFHSQSLLANKNNTIANTSVAALDYVKSLFGEGV